MNSTTEILRKKYMDNPPEGMTSEDIRKMSDEDLLDMDYFLKFPKNRRFQLLFRVYSYLCWRLIPVC